MVSSGPAAARARPGSRGRAAVGAPHCARRRSCSRARAPAAIGKWDEPPPGAHRCVGARSCVREPHGLRWARQAEGARSSSRAGGTLVTRHAHREGVDGEERRGRAEQAEQQVEREVQRVQRCDAQVGGREQTPPGEIRGRSGCGGPLPPRTAVQEMGEARAGGPLCGGGQGVAARPQLAWGRGCS